MSSAPTVLSASRLVDTDGHDGPGWIVVAEGRIRDRGDGPPPAIMEADGIRHTVGMLLPGLVDTHVHGARGVDFGAVGDDPRSAIDHHHATGATTLVASIATSAHTTAVTRVRELRPFVGPHGLAGVHLEGPWLSARRRGAHAADLLRDPDPRELDALLDAGEGAVRMVTLAPELPGAMEAIRMLRAGGVVAAIGHTDADADTTARAVDAGASVVTHLFNGMPPLHHREPGPAGVALTDERLTVELIADGHHLDDLVVDLALHAATGRISLVSDAMTATGLGDGAYELAGSPIVVAGGVARLADGSSLAGSTTTLGAAAARLLARGADPRVVVQAASARPASALGLEAPGLRVGDPADLIVLGDDGGRRVMRRGRWLDS